MKQWCVWGVQRDRLIQQRNPNLRVTKFTKEWEMPSKKVMAGKDKVKAVSGKAAKAAAVKGKAVEESLAERARRLREEKAAKAKAKR
jgi:hypothetical protein